ncbi:MAG: hydrolase [Planctomycetota bacterium]|nr:hydrolase [Planctomycetota bacterium]
MSTQNTFSRSPELMSADDTALLVVDVQSKLVGLIAEHEKLVWNIRRLLDGAKILEVPAFSTVQYPQGLGGMVPELAERLSAPLNKMTFSCGGSVEFCEHVRTLNRPRILVAGIESHVCVQQTVLDLLSEGYRVYVAVDAVGSRGTLDRDIALRRMESSGATLTTTEAALFEWCQASGTPRFKQISQLIRELPPSAGLA